MDEDVALEAQLPLDSVGARLRRARETAGLSRSDIAASTKIPERHLAAIEDGNFAALPARTYAVGFSRSYARVVGLDDVEIARTVRAEVDGLAPDDDRRQAATFEPGDPARVPSSKLAWIAGLAGLLVMAAVAVIWRNYYAPSVTLPGLGDETHAAALPAVTASQPAAPLGGAVVFTALEPGVWVKFYNAAGAQLMQKELALGESYTVPADAQGPQLWTARPQALSITIGGRPVAKLSETQLTMKDVPVSAVALAARAAPAAAQAVGPAANGAGAVTAEPARRQRSAVSPPRPAIRVAPQSTPASDAVPSAAAPTAAPAPSTVTQ